MQQNYLSQPVHGAYQPLEETQRAMAEFIHAQTTGDHYLQTFYETGDVSQVERAVTLYRLAATSATDNNKDHGVCARLSLADALRIQFEQGTADGEAFEEALSLTEEALTNPEIRPADRAHGLLLLGKLLLLPNNAAMPPAFRRAVEVFVELVDVAADSQPDLLIKALAFHAFALTCIYGASGDKDSVYEANAIVDRALGLISRRELAMEPDLTVAFVRARYHRSLLQGNEDDLDQAMEATRDFIANVSPTHPYLHTHWAALGFYHRRKWLLSGKDEDLEACAAAYDEARKRVSELHPSWYLVHGNYASSLQRRYVAYSTLHDLDKAIEVTRMVIDHMDRMEGQGRRYRGRDVYVQNLAQFLEDSYREYGKVELLDEAISVHLGNLKITPRVRKSDALVSLARAYTTRFERQGRPADLEGAISLLEQALECALPGRVLISAANHLATALLAKYDEYGEFSDVERAIAVLRRKDTVLSEHEAQGVYHSLLGLALQRCFVKTNCLEDLEESVLCQQSALKYFPAAFSMATTILLRLGVAQRQLFLNTRNLAMGYEALHSFHYALSLLPLDHPDKSKCLVELGRSELALGEVLGDGHVAQALATFSSAAKSQSWTSDRYSAAVGWAELACKQRMLSEALEAYRLAISLLPELASLELEHELRMRSLSKQAPDLAQDAAACAIELGQLELAVELLEAGKSVVWNMGQELRADLSRLRETAPNLARQLTETSSALEYRQSWDQATTDADRESERRRLQRLAGRRVELIKLVRKESGFENFLLPASYSQLSQAAVRGPVVVLNTSIYRCDALLVQADLPPVLIRLPSLQHEQVRQDASLMSALSKVPKDKRGILFAESLLKNLLRRLWETVGKPVYTEFISRSGSWSLARRMWWCPSGPLSFLPLHACGPHVRMQPDLCDLVISSYIPTLSTLVRARTSASRSCTSPPKMLAVIQPNLPGHPPLPSATEELDVIRNFPGTTTFMVGSSGTVSAVEEKLSSHNWIHLSSHGRQDFLQPMESAIALHDGPFTLLHLTKARLPDAEFAFLSACHSATGAEWIANESMHLAAGFLFAGYKSIVATTRAIADKDAPVVAKAFYAYLTRGGKTPDMTEAAEALRFAVHGLRRAGVPALRWAPFIHIGL